MDDIVIIKKCHEAIDLLIERDSWLLENDLSEQSITHKLAEYLQFLFWPYNVDCEYNGDVRSTNQKKYIQVLKARLNHVSLLKEAEEAEPEIEHTIRAVFPDIIVHRRGTHDQNLCIIEVKKSTSSVSSDYDVIKLEAYTSPANENNLAYQLGIFILFGTGKKAPDIEIRYFKDGRQTR